MVDGARAALGCCLCHELGALGVTLPLWVQLRFQYALRSGAVTESWYRISINIETRACHG